MDVARRISLLIGLGLLGVTLTLGWAASRIDFSGDRGDAQQQMTQATAHFDSLIVVARNGRPRGVRGDEITIALGYLERLRLGLGSPFRLIDLALDDPRLSAAAQTRVAWALLGRLRRGDAYVVDSTVLDARHVAIIDHTIEQADDPRTGELAIRLAYLLASAEGTVPQSMVPVVAEVAAFSRDRQLAIADARRLLSAARRDHVEPFDYLLEQRQLRHLEVEQPSLAPLAPDMRQAAMDAAPRLVESIRFAMSDSRPRAQPLRARASLLGDAVAARLAVLGADQPPLAPIVIMTRGHTSGVSATNEETLAAAYARVTLADDSVRRRASNAVLAAAVGLRAFGQGRPWFADDGGPSIADLIEDYGLANINFDSRVKPAWRPYYLAELSGALADMQRVFPGFSVAGLRVAFTTETLPDSALAMHEPRTRTMRLAINASAGTIAHELTHDLDWQAARRLYTRGGGYSSDRAMHEQRGPLASSMRGLAEARLVRPPSPGTPLRTQERPAELLARSTDWLVASALAQQGRVNGFLSAVQDALLAGYAAGAPTAVGPMGTASLTSALDQMTYLPDSVRESYVSQWSDPSVMDPVLLVKRVLETPMSWRRVGQSGPFPGLSWTPEEGPCPAADASDEARSRARLLSYAVDARARGIASRRARYRGGPPWSPEWSKRFVGSLRLAIAMDACRELSS